MQKVDAAQSKPVTADTAKPASGTSTAVSGAAVRPGTRPVPPATQAAVRPAAGRATAVRGGQTPARGHSFESLCVFLLAVIVSTLQAVLDVGHCYRCLDIVWSVCLSVCLCIGHDCELCKNG